MTGAAGDDERISREMLLMVALIRQRAAAATGAPEIASLATAAAAKGGSGMTIEEIRALGRETLDLAVQVSYYMGKLAGLLDGEEDGPS